MLNNKPVFIIDYTGTRYVGTVQMFIVLVATKLLLIMVLKIFILFNNFKLKFSMKNCPVEYWDKNILRCP